MKELNGNEADAWKCYGCGVLVYNVDENGSPSPGAPPSRYISLEYPKVCNCCWEMYLVLEKLGGA